MPYLFFIDWAQTAGCRNDSDGCCRFQEDGEMKMQRKKMVDLFLSIKLKNYFCLPESFPQNVPRVLQINIFV